MQASAYRINGTEELFKRLEELEPLFSAYVEYCGKNGKPPRAPMRAMLANGEKLYEMCMTLKSAEKYVNKMMQKKETAVEVFDAHDKIDKIYDTLRELDRQMFRPVKDKKMDKMDFFSKRRDREIDNLF